MSGQLDQFLRLAELGALFIAGRQLRESGLLRKSDGEVGNFVVAACVPVLWGGWQARLDVLLSSLRHPPVLTSLSLSPVHLCRLP